MKITEELKNLLREDIMNTSMIYTKIQEFASQHDNVYAEVLKLLTHLDFDNQEAEQYWQAIIKHQNDMSSKLTREVGLRVALLDYFTYINKQIDNPKIIEIAIFEQTVASAMTDSLTTLYNRRYFEENLFREFQRAKRYDLVLSLLMLDIDNFKDYNDTFGHVEGDTCLFELGKIIISCCRDSDIPCRYGGEEFALILPETTGPDSLYLAKRICNMVKSYSTSISDRNPWKRKVTVSCGIASYPIDAKFAKGLVQKADLALYQAKRDGKDRAYLYFEERQRFIRLDKSCVKSITLFDQSDKSIKSASLQTLLGILIQSDQPLLVGAIVQVELEFPNYQQVIRAKMKISRLEVRQDDSYDLGLNFVDVENAGIDVIEESLHYIAETKNFRTSERK